MACSFELQESVDRVAREKVEQLESREALREFERKWEEALAQLGQPVPGGQKEIPPVTPAEWAAARSITLSDLWEYAKEHGPQIASRVGILTLLALVAGCPVFYIVYRILPRRQTNAFYLRAFRNDAATLGMRKTIQRTLGYRAFRLSGIRDPDRRGSPFWRGLNLILLAIRYSTPKYMDLEAGDDWKARLWSSLAEARCAFIDVSDPTPFLLEEVVLAVRSLGLKRVLFLGNVSLDEEAWRHRVAAMLEAKTPDSADIQVAVWGSESEHRRSFVDRVRRFAPELPEGLPGLCSAAVPLIRPSLEVQDEGDDPDSSFWVKMILGMLSPLIWIAILGLVGQALNPSPALAYGLFIAALVPTAIALILFVVTFTMYMIERGFD